VSTLGSCRLQSSSVPAGAPAVQAPLESAPLPHATACAPGHQLRVAQAPPALITHACSYLAPTACTAPCREPPACSLSCMPWHTRVVAAARRSISHVHSSTMELLAYPGMWKYLVMALFLLNLRQTYRCVADCPVPLQYTTPLYAQPSNTLHAHDSPACTALAAASKGVVHASSLLVPPQATSGCTRCPERSSSTA
jgi:hypothetical protein